MEHYDSRRLDVTGRDHRKMSCDRDGTQLHRVDRSDNCRADLDMWHRVDHVHVGPGHHVQRLQMPQHHQLAKHRSADDVVDKTVRVLMLVLKR